MKWTVILRTCFLVIFYLEISNATFELSTLPNTGVVGEDFIFICSYGYIKADFIIPSKTICVITGYFANKTCKLSGSHNTNYTYSCDSSTYNVTIPGKFLTEDMHGIRWTCRNLIDSSDNSAVELKINVPITEVIITTIPTDKNPTEIILNETQNFNCKTNAGRPTSKIQWFISGENISGSATPQTDVCNNCNGKVISSSELTYTGIKPDDGKIIYCTAVNVKGHSVRSENRTIVILHGPSNVTISPETQVYKVNESIGSVGPITCQAHGCKPKCILEWSGPDFTSGNSSELNLQNIDKSMAGNYFCTASNKAWNMTSAKIRIIVNYRPTKVNISPMHQNYTVQEMKNKVGPITCTADCKPVCIMAWDGPNIPDSNTSVLNLNNINRNQEGDYRCKATNFLGSEMSVIVHIMVNYGPGQVSIEPNTLIYTVTETTGEVGPITCTADCNPSCLMTWTGPNINGGSLSELHLQNINRNQAGNFFCIASNSYGNTTSSAVSVIVNYGPILVSISPPKENYTATETIGNIGPINCTADCKPECTITWTGPNFPKVITSVLYLYNISRIHAGYYFCNASNNVSSLTSVRVSVMVNYGPSVVDISPQTYHYIVNETDKVPSITCTADCNPDCEMTWTGPNLPAELPSSSSSMLNISNIARNQSGTYTCDASNIVSRHISLRINITVNFRPAVNSIFGNRSFHENDTAVFSCNVESVPNSKITWFFWKQIIKTSNVVFVQDIRTSNTNVQISSLNISQIGCLSMGTYTCAASNIIGEDTNRIDIDVKCSPRINSIEYNVTSMVAVKDQEPLNITVPIIAYPEPYIFWTFDNNVTSVNVTEKTSNSAVNNRAFSTLYLENVTEKDFGHYNIYAINGIGTTEHYIYSIEVIPKRKPNPPDNVTCFGRPNSLLVYWKSNFNGGDTQSFKIFIKKDGDANFDDNGQNFEDPGRNLYLKATLQQLTPDTTYHLRVHAVNEHNFTESELTICNTTSAVVIGPKETNIAAIGAGTGIGGGVVVLIIVAGIFIFIRRRKTDEKIGQDKELMQRSVDSEENNEDGLRENPLYVSSAQETEGTVYSVVNKNKKNINKEKGKSSVENTIYTEVVKSQKKDKKNKEIEMGCVYQNSENINQQQNEDVYANSEVEANFGDKQEYTPTKNKDGLIYADLDLAPTMNGNRFVIRGLENRNNYAIIDLTKTAEPFPSESDSDDGENNAKKKTEEE